MHPIWASQGMISRRRPQSSGRNPVRPQRSSKNNAIQQIKAGLSQPRWPFGQALDASEAFSE